jgi:hypothetical protein
MAVNGKDAEAASPARGTAGAAITGKVKQSNNAANTVLFTGRPVFALKQATL